MLVGLQQEGLAQGAQRWELEQIGDVAAHDFITDAIIEARPDDGLLSEEGADDGSRTAFDRAWIVDPLDGSSGFGVGNAEWAVHIALSVNGKPEVGAVAVPGMGLIASTAEPSTLPDASDRGPIVVTGRTRAHLDGVVVAEALGAELAACSSAGVKAMLVIEGQADVYVHDGPLYEWDVCAPVAVALAAGLDCCDTSGNPLVFNKSRPVAESLLICRPEYTEAVINALRN